MGGITINVWRNKHNYKNINLRTIILNRHLFIRLSLGSILIRSTPLPTFSVRLFITILITWTIRYLSNLVSVSRLSCLVLPRRRSFMSMREEDERRRVNVKWPNQRRSLKKRCPGPCCSIPKIRLEWLPHPYSYPFSIIKTLIN